MARVAGSGRQEAGGFAFDVTPMLRSIGRPGPRTWIAGVVLAAVVGFGIYAYLEQLREGLAVTGMNRPVYWGVYIGNFVFFVSISLAGTLISAVLRIVKAEWRRPITRCAELVTVLALVFAAVSIVVDMGRPDRLVSVLQHGRFQSPILWDVISISTYLLASTIYLYLPLIPDIAMLRDRGVGWPRLYRVLALGYRGTGPQRRWLERVISVMAVLIIPIGISVHTVTAYLFATTVQPVWHSTIYGPFFVVGALYTGTAVLLIVMALLRWLGRLGGILKDVHFNNLGLLLLAEACLVTYFLVCIYLVEITGQEPHVLHVVQSELQGPFSTLFWAMLIGGILLPPVLLGFRRLRTPAGTAVVSLLVVVAMWVERYLIVVPPLTHPRLAWPRGVYEPSWVEWGITAGCLAGMALLYLAFTKVFPIVSIWEVEEGIHTGIPGVKKRYRSYLPTTMREQHETT